MTVISQASLIKTQQFVHFLHQAVEQLSQLFS
ncbi:hypothetical protein predicted by Glimmer/Critica [Salmonella enterica subsp. enterica serovar Weltevreden str. 2007-60-3289-1]|nr:hypothetical protein predicted by Glimmer/Critica [Salmonella enterica subsp. enterica serovar Weltevreden str. 2007-60-3289-1]